MKYQKSALVKRIDERIQEKTDAWEAQIEANKNLVEEARRAWSEGPALVATKEIGEYFLECAQSGSSVAMASIREIIEKCGIATGRYFSDSDVVNTIRFTPPSTTSVPKQPNVDELKRLKTFLELVDDDIVTSSALKDAGFSNIGTTLA